MKNQTLSVDEHLLDELVTGNLHGDRYRQLLQCLEARPHLWRNCAIAFLKEQALTQDLKALAQGDIDWSRAANKSLPAIAQDDRVRPRTGFAFDLGQPAWAQRLAAVAAMLVCSFAIGWMGAGMRGDGNMLPSADNAIAQAGVLGNAGQVLQDLAGAGSPAVAAVRPVSTASLLDNERFMPLDLQVPPQLRELERQGKIRIETVDAILPVQFEDGSSAIVPVQQFRVVPVIFSY